MSHYHADWNSVGRRLDGPDGCLSLAVNAEIPSVDRDWNLSCKIETGKSHQDEFHHLQNQNSAHRNANEHFSEEFE
jgi:hypothetical protein